MQSDVGEKVSLLPFGHQRQLLYSAVPVRCESETR
jgi:hypothetical protein